MKFKVGLVGAGFAGKFHLEGLQRVHGVQAEVAGVTPLRPESRKAFGKAHGSPVCDDLRAMLPRVALLDVCSPPCAHEEEEPESPESRHRRAGSPAPAVVHAALPGV